ncbi:MAG: flavodoxin family protein, partial [Bacteroidales bacterium]|nr:flavodoxin family protein [Bacteroidales bacterium]
MILYFTGTGNSLAISKKIAEATNDNIIPMSEAAGKDLTAEQTVGLVYPCYDFNTPPAVRDFINNLNINPKAYVYIVITCGAQAGNSIWTVRQILKKKGIRVA